MENLKNWGRRYISGRVVLPKDAVMFDIDDTLILSNFYMTQKNRDTKL